MDPALQELLDGKPDDEIEAIIRLRRPEIIPDGVRVVARFGTIATCRLRRAVVPQVWASEAVASVKASRFLHPNPQIPRQLDIYQKNKNTPSHLHSSQPKATGQDVVVGIIDWGCAFAHPNFRHTDGTTRLLALWDQSRPRPTSEKILPWGVHKYGYGTIYTAAVIDEALRTADPYTTLGYHPADADPDGSGAHGTHVMDIAAGNGQAGGPIGMAPNADLVFVHLATRNISGHANLGDSTTVLEAIDFVAQIAGSKPWVINLSLGSHGGPHDGSTLVEQGLDAALIAAPGRAIVQSTGNYFEEHIHTNGQLRPGEQQTITLQVSPADMTPNELEIWYSGRDRFLVEIHSPHQERIWAVPLGEQATLVIGEQVCGKVYHRAHDPNNGDHHLDLFLYPGGPVGNWAITLTAEHVVDGCFHAWIERDAGCLHCQTRFLPEDNIPASTTGAICNGLHPITVGAYNPHSSQQEVAPFSSGGPTRDGRQKPDLLAPGVAILAARSPDYMAGTRGGTVPKAALFVEKSGTSMAAPHVTGTIACMFEAAQRPLWIHETRQLLLQNTTPAAAAQGDTHRVGNGYLDSVKAIAAAAQLKLTTVDTLSPKPEVALAEQPSFTRHIKSKPLQLSEGLPYWSASLTKPSESYDTKRAERSLKNSNSHRSGIMQLKDTYDLILAPGARFTGNIRAGDLLVRRIAGKAGQSQVTIIANAALLPYDRLRLARQVSEKHSRGWYVRVIEKDRSNHHNQTPARLLVDETGRLPHNLMVLRRKSPGITKQRQTWADGSLAEALPDMTLVQKKIDEAIETARKTYPDWTVDLNEVTLRCHMTADEFAVHIIGEEKISLYPIQIFTTKAGFYLLKWNSTGKALYLIDLATGKEPKALPDAPLLAGGREWEDLRRGRVGVIWITVTVTEPPPTRPLQPDDLELPLHLGYEILAEKFHLLLEKNPPHPLTIPGVTGGTFFPEHMGETNQPGYYGRPLNFTYYTHDGISALVSRQFVGREFYYVVPIDHIQNYLRTYALEYAGLASMGSAIIAQMLVDMGLNFVPILGPLYGLVQCVQSVVAAYENWEKLSSWEVAIVGLDVFLNLVPIVYTGVKVVRGAKSYRKGVDILVKAGLPKVDAHRLMLGGGIFQSEKSARRIVDSLSDMLRRGNRFGPQELIQAEDVLRLMLEQLPEFERLTIAAALATRSRETMREFFDGTDLLKQHLDGLTQLNPRTLAILKGVARTKPDTVQRIAYWVERSPDVAQGIHKLEAVLKDAHLPHVLSQAGEELLADLGRSSLVLSADLVDYVQKASNATEAYTRLMRGATATLRNGTKPKGLIDLLTTTRSGSLSPALSAVEQQFSHILLSVNQLDGLARLDNSVRQTLLGTMKPGASPSVLAAAGGRLRSIATMAAASADVVTAMNNLAPSLPGHLLPEILDELGYGILEIVGSKGYTLSSNLTHVVSRQSLASKAIHTLLEGSNRTTPPVSGMLDELADLLKTTTNIQSLLAHIEAPRLQSELFARWAVTQQSSLKGISTILTHRATDGQEKISAIFRAFDYDVALDIFEMLEQIERLSGTSLNGLDRMIGELAAGAKKAEKAMGATFTLTYAMQRFGGRIGGFEVIQTGRTTPTPTRHYDLWAGGVYYEFKHWTGFGGEPAVAAADEFARDVLLHVDTNFSHLRWVIHRQAESSRLAIESMMRGVMARPDVQTGLAQLGITSKEALRRLEAATWLLEFYD